MTSAVRRREQDDSGEYSDASQENEQNNSTNDAAAPESDYESRGSEDSDLSGSVEINNQDVERRVDDDEDRSNPQYIPKRGTFYEHDDRTADGGEEKAPPSAEGHPAEEGGAGGDAPAERRRPPRKSEACDKWSHDKYNENEQMPKSRDELVSVYGYDIRNEDAPPHARRNRRYGRGPNKYTRTWEDEEAYKRQDAIKLAHRKPPNPEDFPELEKSMRKVSNKKGRPPRSRSQPNDSNESLENGDQLRRNASIKLTKPATAMAPKQNAVAKKVFTKQNASLNKGGTKSVANDVMPPIENLSITATVNNASSPSQRKMNTGPGVQLRPVPTAQPSAALPTKRAVQQAPVPTQQQNSISPRVPAQPPAQPQSQKPQQSQLQPSVPPQPGATESRPGSKRYSSLRQRPLAENYSPQPQHRYMPEYQQAPAVNQHQGSPVAQMHPQSQLLHQVVRSAQGTAHGPSPPHPSLPQQPQHNQAQLPQQQLPQQQLPQQQLQQQQLPQQQLPQQQLPQQQLPQQQLPQQQLPQQQLPQQQLPQQQLPQQQLPQPQLPQQQLTQQQLSQQQLAQQQLPQQQLTQQQLTQQQLAQQQLPPQQLPPQQLPPQQLPQQQLPPGQHPQQVRLNMLEQQQLVTHAHAHPMHNMPQPHNMVPGQLPPAQSYPPPGMMPAQYMQGGNNAAVYGGAPMYAQPPAPYPHQIYQHHNYAAAGGVTYYSPVEQEPQQPRTLRRPTAAIPIVRPTQERPANSSEKDNIDRIVENMFVRKPWPATRASDSSKEKSQESRSSQEPTSKESSQPPSLTSSSISTESRPSAERTEPKDQDITPDKEPTDPTESTRTSEEKEVTEAETVDQKVEDSIANEA